MNLLLYKINRNIGTKNHILFWKIVNNLKSTFAGEDIEC